MNNTINNENLQSLIYSLNVLRIKNDIAYLEKEIERIKPKAVKEKDNIFSKFGKNVSNSLNASNYQELLKELDAKREFFISVKAKAVSEEISVLEDKEEIAELVEKTLSSEITEMRIVYLSFSLIFSAPYYGSELTEDTRAESFEEIALMLGLPKDTFNKYEKSLIEKYNAIAGKDFVSRVENVFKQTNEQTLLLIVLGLGAFGVLAGILGVSVLGSVVATTALVLFLGTQIHFNNDKKIFETNKEMFYKLTPNELDFVLLQKMAILEVLKDKRDNPDIDEIYKNMIDDLINIKSDIDLALFAFNDNVNNINYKKKESLLRFDKYLLKLTH